jgi:ASCH domain
MNLYIQYHNIGNEGLLLADPLFSGTSLGIHTRRSQVQKAEGQVFLVAGVGKPRRYFLWETFKVEEIRSKPDGTFEAFGTGWQLAPPQLLSGRSFDAFRETCANFVGFRCINDLAYSRTLTRLAEDFRPPGEANRIHKFLKGLADLIPDDGKDRKAVLDALSSYEPMRALSIRQPHAEAIMRGVKKIEYRSGPTTIRGRIVIYASLGRYRAEEEVGMMDDYRITDVSCDDLPRGVLIGTVDLYRCDGGDWHVRNPERAEKLLKPTNQPQPVWFHPS